MSSKRLERINAFIKDYIDTNQIAGAVTLVARKGKIVHFEAQGWRYKEEKQPMEKDAIFSLASMTKPIVSTALMMLWEDGKFMLDDPISKWLPSYANKQVLDPLTGRRTPARPVTVRHVLSHTSGLSLTPSAGPEPAHRRSWRRPRRRRRTDRAPGACSAGGSARPKTLLEAIERAAGSPLAFQPGERWQYGSSTDFVGILVEKMSGMTLDEYVRTKIFQPLGMRDTFYNVPQEKVGKVAAIYRPDKDGKITLFRKPEFREPTTYFPGVAGLNGTAADYFRFSQMLLNGGEYNGQRLLGRMTVNTMITNQIGAGKPVYIRGDGYGFGLGFARPDGPGEVARRAVDRQLHVGRRQRHALLDRSAGGSHRHPDDSDQPVLALQHPAVVLGGRDAGDHRQPRGSEAAHHGLRHAAVGNSNVELELRSRLDE